MTRFASNTRMRFLLLLPCIGALLCGFAFAQNPSPKRSAGPAKSDAQTSFAGPKSLAGSWSGTVTTEPSNPDLNGPIQVTIRAASRGTAIMHEILSGGMPEPTLIYLENGRLTLVHYCDADNRPRLTAIGSPDHKIVEFHFVDISGNTKRPYLRFASSARATIPKT